MGGADAILSVMVLGGGPGFAEALQAVLAAEEGLRLWTGAAEESSPAILLIDVSFHPEEALALAWSARERFPEAQVVALGLEREDESVLEFIEAGAAAYLLRGESPERLIEVLRFLREGQVHSTPRIAAAVLERIVALEREHTAPVAAPACDPLSARELETLKLMARGLRNKEIARALRITVQTVKKHVHSVLEKLRVHRRRDAVRRAFELGLLSEPLDLF
jgi:DNA-binding NarL/FixJ family response regulator